MTKSIALSSLCVIDRAIAENSEALPYVGLDQVASGTGEISLVSGSRTGSGDGTSFRFDARHVLYGKLRPYLNKVALPDFAGKCTTELMPLRPNDGVERSYLAYLLRRQETIDRVMAASTGARMPRADMKVLLSMEVPCPSLSEQRRIVDILDRAASIQKLRQQAEAKAQEIIPALFVDMFGDPATNPCGWPICQLSDVWREKPRYGTMVPATDVKKDRLCLRVANIQGGELSRRSEKYVNDDEIDLERHVVLEGDILLARAIASRDHLGKCIVARPSSELWAFDSHLMLCRLNVQKMLPEYLSAYLQSTAGRQEFLSHSRRSAVQYNINTKEFGKISAPLPPIELQTQFARFVHDATALRERSSQANAKIAEATSALLQKYLNA